MILIRITDADGSNAVVFENARDRKLAETINSADEGISFSIAKNDPKADVINPEYGYTKFWEAWDTETRTRLNYGPLTSVSEDGPDWKVEGKGRSALLDDYISTKKVFLANLGTLVDSLRYENIAEQPHVSTLVHDNHVTAAQTTVFGSVTIDEKYYGLSTQTKDNVIDGVTNIPANQAERPNTYYTVDSFWSGMSKNDSIIIDLGEEYPIDLVRVYFPWWGGKVRHDDRTYDYTIGYATGTGGTTSIGTRKFNAFTDFWSKGPNSHEFGPATQEFTGQSMRYIRVHVTDVHAWYGTPFDTQTSVDGWDHQCNPNYVVGSFSGVSATAKAVMTDPISDRTLKPENDCHASVLEVQAMRKFLPVDLIRPLARQRIDNNNMQITYFHTPDPSEIFTTDAGYRQFEPGGFFRKFSVSWSGANTTYTKFFSSDCSNCYPDGFNFGIMDQDNTLIYSSDSTSGTSTRDAQIYTKSITMKGSSSATINWVDTWQSSYDPLSWGASYSWTSTEGDYASIHFRGQSFRWFATVPADKVGATVRIDIRSKTDSSSWSGWTTLENNFVLPNDISSTLVYEITYESGILAPDITYEIKIVNLDGSFCSIDSIEGFWSGSMNSFNEDSRRWTVGKPEQVVQIYDNRYSEGSMYKWHKKNFMNVRFTGDRAVLLSYKGRHHGKLKILLERFTGNVSYDEALNNRVFIPGGSVTDGSLTVNLDTGKRGEEIPGYIMFDTNDYFPSGLPWASYKISWYLDDIETFSAYPVDITEVFKPRCQYCADQGQAVTTNKWVYFDGGFLHEQLGISVTFQDQTHLEQIKALAEASQVEWGVTEDGIRFEPRIGEDTNIVLREGQDTVVKLGITSDIGKVASILFSEGANIDGLPLSTVVEDRSIRRTLGRTVMRKQDFREVGDYLQLVGLGRTELKKRKLPEKRIEVTHIASNLSLNKGDSFILFTKKTGPFRVRIIHKEVDESDGRVYNLECIKWPIIT
jgi:hypothetical protein